MRFKTNEEYFSKYTVNKKINNYNTEREYFYG